MELQTDLKEVLLHNDHYTELKNILQIRPSRLPIGSLNTKVIINDGEIVERVYKTPNGQVVSLYSKSSNSFSDQAA